MMLVGVNSLAQTPAVKVISVNNVDINVEQFGTDSKRVLLWLPSEVGFPVEQKQIAHELNRLGVDVWFADLVSALFLPQVPSSLSQIPPELVSALIKQLVDQDKRVYVLAEGDAVVTALSGARHYRGEFANESRFAGLILISGKFFVDTPEPGHKAQWYPVTEQVKEAIYFLQPEKSPWHWTRDETVRHLQQHGNVVFTQSLPKIRDRFYFRPDQTELEHTLSIFIPDWLANAMAQVDAVQMDHTQAPAAQGAVTVKPQPKLKQLQAYTGENRTPNYRLMDLRGHTHTLDELHGRVVLVNYWASWCPPCVHELPSLNQLSKHFADSPFSVVGINMAENPDTINQFMAQTPIDFQVLMDSDGGTLKRWEVYAFPTSFLLDKNGVIRFAVIGAIEWMDAEVLAKVKTLLQ